MRRFHLALGVAFAAGLAACADRPAKANDQRVINEREIESDGTTKVMAEIWVDNWFALSVNGAPLIQDSVPFKTERSFNAERVTFNTDLPATIAFEFRDFRENDTGLEYIGTGRQQIGDGGAIVQFTDAETGALLKVSNSTWKCLVINRAPLDEACAKESDPQEGEGPCAAEIRDAPANWTDPNFDDSQWAAATEYSAREVSPKDGYDEVDWKPGAKLIWSDNLKLDNTLLCRTVIARG
mgnify:CR=1 FL=1|jgi:hypothetical protein